MSCTLKVRQELAGQKAGRVCGLREVLAGRRAAGSRQQGVEAGWMVGQVTGALMLREKTYHSAQGRAGGRLAGALLRTRGQTGHSFPGRF